MGLGRRRTLRAATVALALALVALPAIKPDPAGAALPIVVNDTSGPARRQHRQRRLRHQRRPLHAACRDPGGQRAARPRHDQRAARRLRARDPVVNEDTPSTGDHDIADSVTIVGTGAGRDDRRRRLPDRERTGRGARHRPPVRDPPDRRQRHVPRADDPRGLLRGGRRRHPELVAGPAHARERPPARQPRRQGRRRPQQRRPVRLRVADRLAAADRDDPERPRRDHGLQARRQLGRRGRRRDQQRQQRQRHDHRQRGRRQPGPDDPGPGAVHRPARARADRVHPRAGRLRARRPARSSTRASSRASARSGSSTRCSRATSRRPTAPAFHGEADGTLEIADTRIEDNTTEGNGGGIYTNGGKVTITRTVFDENLAHANGGGLLQRRRGQQGRSAQQDRDHATRRSRATRRGRRRARSHSDGDGELHAHRRRHRRQRGDRGRRRRLRGRRPLEPGDDPRHGHRQLRLQRGRRRLHRQRAPDRSSATRSSRTTAPASPASRATTPAAAASTPRAARSSSPAPRSPTTPAPPRAAA